MAFLHALMSIVPWVASVGMVIGPVSPYLPQYLETKRTGVAGGFSPMVAFLLMLSSVGRVFYWFLLRFDNTLLWQALVMIVAQLALLQQQVALMAKSGRQASLWDFRFADFWQWTSFTDYLVVLCSVTLLLSVVVFILQGNAVLAVAIGYLSLIAESSISMPQFVTNCRRGTTVGLSAIMIAMWFSGDCYKLVYFVVVPVPSTFLICAVIQSVVDFLISLQIVRTKCRERGRCGAPVHRRLGPAGSDDDVEDDDDDDDYHKSSGPRGSSHLSPSSLGADVERGDADMPRIEEVVLASTPPGARAPGSSVKARHHSSSGSNSQLAYELVPLSSNCDTAGDA